MRLKFLLLTLSFAIAGFSGAQAQMSDSSVIEYVKAGQRQGKGEHQIGRELLARGVTAEQLERIKSNYESGSDAASGHPDSGVSDAARSRSHDSSEEMTAGRLDGVTEEVSSASVSTDDPFSEVYGRSVFRSASLTFEPNENQATPENYRLGPGDEVIIDIWGANEDTVRATISPEGSIQISQVGPIYLNGQTIAEAQTHLRQILSQKYSGISGEDPESDIRVTLGRIRTIQVNVLGEVSTPGTYRLSSFSTVFHALYKAGGVSPIGTLRNIEVHRGGSLLRKIDVYEYLFRGSLESDIRLSEGDVVLVRPYELRASVSGNVKRPMHYELKQGETLSDLLRYAGDFTGDAYRDEVRLTRGTGREYALYNVPSGSYGSWAVEDGDAVTVGATLDRYSNRVEVRGSVYRPGMYELGDRIRTVGDLVSGAEGVTEDAFVSRAQLYREGEDLSLEMLALDLSGILSGRTEDVVLRRNDVLVIPSIHELESQGTLTIGGEVSRPGTYAYAENTTLEDLIVRAGGLLDGASTARVDVSRRLKDPKGVEPSRDLSRIYSFSLKDGLVEDGTPGFVLCPYDIVDVRRSPSYRRQQQVSVSGEVVFPGAYTLVRKNERLSDLVQRSGGVTEDAYVRGARLLRRMNDDERALRDETLRMASADGGSDSLSANKVALADTYVVGIELDRALSAPGSDYDMVLREGDHLVIPEYVSTVSITGDVMRPNTVLYRAGQKLKDYVAQAGGYGSRAKRSRVYVVYMNGTMSVARRLGRTRIEPGCQIIVPTKRERRRTSLAEIMGLTTSAASLGTMAASIANLSK